MSDFSAALLAVSDSSYVEKFIAYAAKKGNLPFKITGFSEPGALLNYMKRRPPDLLLLSKGERKDKDFLKQEDEAFRAVFQSEKIKKIIMLCGKDSAGFYNLPLIEKYQSAAGIINEIKTLCDGLIPPAPKKAAPGLKISGIYPLEGRHGCTLYSLSLAASSGSNSLYMPLDGFSGLTSAGDLEGDLSDLIFLFKSGSQVTRNDILNSVRKTDGVSVLAPPACAEDLFELSARDWADFTDIILKTGGFDSLVIETCPGTPYLCDILGLCDKIYLYEGAEGGPRSLNAEKLKEKAHEEFMSHLSNYAAFDFEKRLNIVREHPNTP